MALPPGFPFTQTALRSYLECPYRFRLRYLEGIPWSGLPPDPAGEAAVERGRLFHELARQHFLGLDVAGQAAAQGAGALGEETRAWWLALRDAPPDLAAYPRHFPEAGLSIPLGDYSASGHEKVERSNDFMGTVSRSIAEHRYRLAARYDLLAMGEERALIVDWKTGADLSPRSALAGDIQTRVYLYVLAAGSAVYGPLGHETYSRTNDARGALSRSTSERPGHAGRPLSPQALALLYWHPRGPQQVRLSYSAAQQAVDGAFLEALVREIVSRRPEELRPTSDEAVCGNCAYATLCGKGAGQPLEWAEEDHAPEAAGWEDL